MPASRPISDILSCTKSARERTILRARHHHLLRQRYIPDAKRADQQSIVITPTVHRERDELPKRRVVYVAVWHPPSFLHFMVYAHAHWARD